MSQMLSIVSPVGRVLCCLLGLTLSGGAGLWALADGEYLLQFDQVLWNKRRSEARPLFVEVVKRENVWLSTCFGHAPTYNKGEYAGVVTPITAPSPGQEALRIELPVQDDYWVPGGAFAATVVLEAIADGHHGSFVGTWRDHAINGVLQVQRRAPPPTLDAVLAGLGGTHPRLLVDGLDDARLARAATLADGQALLDRLRELLATQVVWNRFEANAAGHAAGHALLYAVTGSSNSAAQAQELIWVRMRRAIGGPHLLVDAREVLGVAIAYDLCYPVWEPAFRASVTSWLERQAAALAAGQEAMTKLDADSRWNAVCRSAALIAGLAIAGDRGRYQPRPPVISRHQIVAGQAEPPKELRNKWQPEQMPEHWILAGPFLSVVDEDVLADLGGSASARPEAGTTVAYQGQQRRFRPLRRSWIVSEPYTHHRPAIDLLAPIDRAYHTTTCYTTALRFKQAGVYRFGLGNSSAVAAKIFVNGQEINDGDVLDLAAGWYRLLIRVEVGATQDWGAIWMEPRFHALDELEAEAVQISSGQALSEWEQGYQEWLAAGRPVLSAAASVRRALRHLRRFVAFGLAADGAVPEGDAAQIAVAESLLPASDIWRRLSGEGLVDDPRLGRLLPQLAQRLSRSPDDRLLLSGFGLGGERLKTPGVLLLGAGSHTPPTAAALQGARQALFPAGPAAVVADPLNLVFAYVGLPLQPTDTAPPSLATTVEQLVLRPAQWQTAPLIACLQTIPGSPINAPADAGALAIYGGGRRWCEAKLFNLPTYRHAGAAVLRQRQELGPGRDLAVIDLAPVFVGKEGRPPTQAQRWFASALSADGQRGRFLCIDLIDTRHAADWRLDAGDGLQISGGKDRFVFAAEDGSALHGQVLQPTGRLQVDKKGITIDAPAGRTTIIVALAVTGAGQTPAIDLTERNNSRVITIDEDTWIWNGETLRPE